MPEPRAIYPKHYFQDPPPLGRKGFILIPFKPEFAPVYEAIKEAILSAGLHEASKANDLKNYNTRAGMEQILKGIAEANVVVADMTGANENVFYETGIAHTVKENVVLITQDTGKLPFDSRHIPHIPYDSSAEGLRKLVEQLSQVISSLPDEPRFGIRSAGIAELSVVEIRRELRPLIKECEQDWMHVVIPAQIEVFQKDFHDRMFRRQTYEEQEKVIAESMRAIQPAFLRKWQPIEEFGFEVIAQERNDAIRHIMESLEHAYALPQTWKGTNAPTVTGHGQLLALRTWTLWGAWALDCENWGAVYELLHRQVNFSTPYGEKSESFADHEHIHYPDAAGSLQGYGNCDLAVRSIYNPPVGFTEQRFFSTEERQGFIGLWLFAADIAHPLVWPSWFLAPKNQFNRLLKRLESDSLYANEFAQAIVGAGSSTFNHTWQSGLRERLLNRNRLGSGYHPWVLEDFQFPKHFAE